MPPKSKQPRKSKRHPKARKFLVEPIREFRIPSHSWQVDATALPLKPQQVYYDPPEHVNYMGQPLLRITARIEGAFKGHIYMPKKYAKLWRHLIYGAIYWEKLYKWYRHLLRKVGRRDERRDATVILRDNAGVKYVQYMICRRKILEELMKVRFDRTGDVILPTFIEFGIRHFRDWLHDDFAFANQADAQYLRMDPTLAANEAKFTRGYHGKMPAEMNPPKHNDWWSGQIDLSTFFSTQYPNALEVMVGEEFWDDSLLLADKEDEQPDVWTEGDHPEVTLFSDNFDTFLKDGQDPRSHPKRYLEWYATENTVEYMKNAGWWELAVVLGSEYYRKEESWINRIQSLDDQYTWRDLVDEVLLALSTKGEAMLEDKDKSALSLEDDDQTGPNHEEEGNGDPKKGHDKEGDMMDVDATNDQDGNAAGGQDQVPTARNVSPPQVRQSESTISEVERWDEERAKMLR